MPTLDAVRVEEARAHFPGAEQGVFMNVAQRGLLPIPVRQAVDRYLDSRVGLSWDKDDMFVRAERTRGLFADLIGCQADEIAYTKNVTDGINLIANAIEWRAGDRVVLCPDLDHPANFFPWQNLARRKGIEVIGVPSEEGRIPVERIVEALDERTRVVTVPTITFAPGFLTDLASLVPECRRRGVLLIVDAAQSVGIHDTDVCELGVDALAVATQKGLLSLYGLGFLYCRKELAESLLPPSLGRFGVDLGEGVHETAMMEGFTYAPGARRFDLGNLNYLAITAAEAALELIMGIGTSSIEPYVRARAARLADGLLDLGLSVAGGRSGEHLGHIVTLGERGGGRGLTAGDPAMDRLHRHLSANGVHLSIRRGMLRLSLHVYNNDHDVDQVLELAGDWVSGRGREGGLPAGR